MLQKGLQGQLLNYAEVLCISHTHQAVA